MGLLAYLLGLAVVSRSEEKRAKAKHEKSRKISQQWEAERNVAPQEVIDEGNRLLVEDTINTTLRLAAPHKDEGPPWCNIYKAAVAGDNIGIRMAGAWLDLLLREYCKTQGYVYYSTADYRNAGYFDAIMQPYRERDPVEQLVDDIMGK